MNKFMFNDDGDMHRLIDMLNAKAEQGNDERKLEDIRLYMTDDPAMIEAHCHEYIAFLLSQLDATKRQVSELREAADEAFGTQVSPSMLGILSPTDTEERVAYERYQTVMNRTQLMLYSMYNKAKHAPRQENAK